MPPVGALVPDSVLPLTSWALSAGVVAGVVGVGAAVASDVGSEVGSDVAATSEAGVPVPSEVAAGVFCEACDTCCARFWNRLTRSAKAAGDRDWMRLAT